MPIVGEKIGAMKLVFMDDYYASIFKCPFKKEDVYTLMSDFCKDINTKALMKFVSFALFKVSGRAILSLKFQQLLSDSLF